MTRFRLVVLCPVLALALCVAALLAAGGQPARADGGSASDAGAASDPSSGLLPSLPTDLPTGFPTEVPTGAPTTPSPTTGPTGAPSATASPSGTPAEPGSPDPTVVVAPDGERFYAPELTVACDAEPADLRKGLRELARTARLIRESGRRAVIVIAPGKTSIDPLMAKLDGVAVPDGACARRGLRQQDRILDTWDDPSYLPLRQRLSRDRRQLYWHTDHHWNTVGASVWARQLVKRLAPDPSGGPKYVPGGAAFHGSLNPPQFAHPPEVGPALFPSPRTKVTPRAGEPDIDTEYIRTHDHRWRTSPRSGTVRGRTLLLGDSYTYLGLNVLRPAVSNGHFMWSGLTDIDDQVRAILDADTVVLESYQLFAILRVHPFAQLRRALRDALRDERAGRPSPTRASTTTPAE